MGFVSFLFARFFHNEAPLKGLFIGRSHCFGIFLLIGAMLLLLSFDARGQKSDIFRVGFTYKAFGEVNENDAMASVRAWAHAFVQERRIRAIPEPTIFKSISEIKAALSGKTVEALNITTSEFVKVREMVAEDVVICGVISNSITEEYLLLVNRKSNIKKLSNLKGRTLGMVSSLRASLAPTWLDTLLLREGLTPTAGFFGQVYTNPKVGDLLISLFFEKLDACVATRRGFDIMVELNPQTGRQLEILEYSHPVVPTVFCFRKDYTSPVRNQILVEIQRWHLSPAGKQSLTIFQTDSLKEQSIDCLNSALELLEEHQELIVANNTPLSETLTGNVAEGDNSERPAILRTQLPK